jgi:hypothetical protein
MRTDDIFTRLPRPTALLLLSSIFRLTDAHFLQNLARQTPQPTITIPHHALNVVSWPIRPTPPPGAGLFAFRRRQLEDNTVCGYIAGDEALPATCGSGSHCVVDTEHNVVGCCPNGAPSCTAGVFTGCVDANSGPQTEVNPYVFSCAGENVCYMNVFDGGFSQYGCGTASDMAATVLNTASGVTAVLTRPTVSVSYTESISILSEPTTLGTITSSSTGTSSSSSASSSSADSTTVLDPAATTDATAAAPPAPADTGYRTGAIIGGTIGGLAVLIALVALAFFFLRRRSANVRQGPGPGGVRGKVISPPQPGSGTGFAALAHDDIDAFETGPASSVFNQPPQQQQQQPQMTTFGAASTNRAMLPPLATGPPMPFQSEVSPVDHHDLDTAFYSNTAAVAGGGGAGGFSAGGASVSSYPPSSSGGLSGGAVSNITRDTAAAMYLQQQYPGPHPASYAGGSGLLMGMNPLLLNRGPERHLESDQIPLTGSSREIDDFSQGFHAALGRIGEEDEEDQEDQRGYHQQQQGQHQQHQQQQLPQGGGYRDDVGGGADGEGTMDSTGSGSGRPLWQQNRRQSRKLMWM